MNPIDPQSLDTLFLKARTANGFLNKPVAPELLQRVYELAALAPTSMNTQPTRYVFLNSQESRERLLPAMLPGNLDKTQSAPVTVIVRSEEHTSELQSLMRISYAVFCLNKKTNYIRTHNSSNA